MYRGSILFVSYCVTGWPPAHHRYTPLESGSRDDLLHSTLTALTPRIGCGFYVEAEAVARKAREAELAGLEKLRGGTEPEE